VNHDFVDRFTPIHAGIGATYGLLHLPPAAVLLLALAWELLENPLKAFMPALFPHATRDTLRNMVGDVLAVFCGWALVRWAAAA
jgi:hypothetical protein